ncbi:tannase and feruloyl esterase [Echria macrotheca]|uniref:Carboxylic ester hydrolase n=1 Tax=Echria macrotheca TaxID=438768 RepID=A0AAJ0B2J2_9PEZI|nr:tannase and feruloyl esterase [Echria macrotheca]
MSTRFMTVLGGLSVLAAMVIAHPTSLSQHCSNFPRPEIAGASVLSISSAELNNHTVAAFPPILNQDVVGINVCEVNVTLSHPNANDTVHVQIWLPASKSEWNGRLISLGGSAWAAGHGPLTLAPYAAKGFAAISTDAGLDGNLLSPAGWALKDDGMVNTELLTNFASRSVHEMVVAGKQLAASYYQKPAAFSYWEGCSTGGRQGLVAAQQYPGDFDGILAGAPAIYWTKYVVSELWPQVAMREAGYYPSACEFQAARTAAVAACDELDGVKDGVISDLAKCSFNPFSLVGKKINCNGNEVVLSKQLASVVDKIWQGPKTSSGSPLWYGLNIGAPLDSLAATLDANGTRVGDPFFVARDWVRYFVKADPEFAVQDIDSASLRNIFAESVAKFSDIIDSSSPDLAGFRRAGGKLLIWHGEADNLIFTQDSIRYRDDVQKHLGNGYDIDQFFRLFLAPGVDHCGLGSIDGAVPTNSLESLVNWVENGKAPQEIAAASLPTAASHFTRKLCQYPLVAKYDGKGDQTIAASYRCVRR